MNSWVVIHFWKNIMSMLGTFIMALPLAIVAGCVCVFILKKKNMVIGNKKAQTIVLLVVYIATMLQMAIFFRTFGSINEIDLIPFNRSGGFRYIVLYGIANIFIFLPVGILPPIIWRKMNNVKLVLLAGLCVSLFIEIAQLTLQCGVCQTEDLIMNTAGAGVGYWIYKKRICLKQNINIT